MRTAIPNSRALRGTPPVANTNRSVDGTFFQFGQRIPESKGAVYKGKVVMLINEDTINQAEHTCLFFQAASKVTFVGTPTRRADGDVTNTVLPGNIVVRFSGQDVRHAD